MRRVRRLDRADLGDRHLPVREHLEHERLEFFVAAIRFVHQEHRRLRLLRDRLEQRPAQQEGLREDLVLSVDHRAIVVSRFLELDVQELLLVVPLVERGGDVEPLVTLEPDQVRREHSRHHLGDLGLPHAGRAFDEQRLVQPHREVNGRRDRRIGDVLGRFHHLLDLPDLVAHG